MSFLIENWFPAFMALASGSLLLWPLLTRGAQGQAVSPSEAVQLINREKAVLIDVCEAEEFAAGHVPGSRHIPLGQLSASGGAAKGLPSNKSLPVIIVCASGARATRAAALLRKAGFERPVPLAGGMRAWRDANLPVESGKAG